MSNLNDAIRMAVYPRAIGHAALPGKAATGVPAAAAGNGPSHPAEPESGLHKAITARIDPRAGAAPQTVAQPKTESSLRRAINARMTAMGMPAPAASAPKEESGLGRAVSARIAALRS